MTVTNAVETTMVWGTVSGATMVGMVISLLLSMGLPIFLCIFIHKKTKAWVPAFFIGCGIFVGFAMILEQICHAIVLTVTGSVIRDNIWLYAIYGGLMEKTMTALEPAQQEVTYNQLSVLWTTPAYQFYLAPVERISAIALQIALSIPTWALELGLLVTVAAICVAVYKMVYMQVDSLKKA